MVVEANKAEDQIRKLSVELEKVGIRLNKKKTRCTDNNLKNWRVKIKKYILNNLNIIIGLK